MNPSILNVAQNYDNPEDDLIFKDEIIEAKPVEVKEKIKPQAKEETQKVEINPPKSEIKPKEKKREWTPDTKVINEMPELAAKPITYSKEEFKVKDDKSLKNFTDESAKEDAKMTVSEMRTKNANIDKVMRKLGIKKLSIPDDNLEGKTYRFRILNAASDPKSEVAEDHLTKIFIEMMKEFPEFILEKYSDEPKPDQSVQDGQVIDDLVTTDLSQNIEKKEEPKQVNEDQVDIIIDKKDAPELTFSDEEIDKIKKARTIRLQIVDDMDLKFNSIEEEDDINVIDDVLNAYRKKIKDVSAVLPASRYRCSIRGLTFTELMDISYQSELNDQDRLKKIWTMIYDHIINPSIPFEEYRYYIDPKTHKEVKITPEMDTNTIGDNIIKTRSRFEDFMRKTASADFQFLIWKIICATSLDSELISITCNNEIDGKPCGNRYDWIYSPADLLDMNSVSKEILANMEETANATTPEAIMKSFNESLVNKVNTVELPSSKIKVLFGHISAYDFTNTLFKVYEKLDEEESNAIDKEALSGILQAIKGFLIPKDDKGNYMKIINPEGIIKIYRTLNEIDYFTILEIVKMVVFPFQFKFRIKDTKCKRCKKVQDVEVDNLSDLLFLVSQAMNQTQITLKKI